MTQVPDPHEGHVTVEMPPSLDSVLAPFIVDDQKPDWRALADALRSREDKIADFLTLMAAMLGSEPRLVSYALMQSGLGTPPDEATREFIHQNYHAGLEWLRSIMGGGQGD